MEEILETYKEHLEWLKINPELEKESIIIMESKIKMLEKTMEKELKRVYITQDTKGVNYVIPYEMKDMFNNFRNDNYMDNTFTRYATGGDINLIELYARI